jgi:hypothetical protein
MFPIFHWWYVSLNLHPVGAFSQAKGQNPTRRLSQLLNLPVMVIDLQFELESFLLFGLDVDF